MFFLFLRLSPWFVAVVSALVSSWQWRAPALYPWPLVMGLCVYVIALIALLWRSSAWRAGAIALLPAFFSMTMIGFGHLMIEETVLRVSTTAVFAFIPWLALELGWFMLYESHHYPARAFTRLNLALVPLSMWYLLTTLQGIQVFLQILSGMLMALCVFATVLWFVITIRSWKDQREKRWIWASLVIGGHVALLLVLLPVSMPVQGALAALLVALPLRLRHLVHERGPFFRALWLEGGLLCVLWIGILFSARWG